MSKKIELNCAVCTKPFKVYRYYVTNRGQKFCSIACQHVPGTKVIPTKEEIINLYWVEKLSTNQLSKHYKVSKGTIYNWFKKYSIGTRTISKSVSIAQTGILHAEAHCQAISKGSKGKITPHMYGKNNPIFKNSSAGHYAKGGTRADIGIYVRSSWEANYCRYLNFLKANGVIYDWKFEPDTFYFDGIKRGCVSYTPDFKLWDTRDSKPYYVEVKGWMDDKSKTKIKRMAKYYPDVRLDVVAKKEYTEIKKKLSRLITGWE